MKNKLEEEIQNACSIDMLRGLKEEIDRRRDIKPVEKAGYILRIIDKIDYFRRRSIGYK